MDWGFNVNSRKLKMVIKFLRKDAMLAPHHVSADQQACRHQDQLMAFMWHLDKSEKILDKLSNIAYQM